MATATDPFSLKGLSVNGLRMIEDALRRDPALAPPGKLEEVVREKERRLAAEVRAAFGAAAPPAAS